MKFHWNEYCGFNQNIYVLFLQENEFESLFLGVQ